MEPSRAANAIRYREYIAANVSTLRRRAGMTQAQLAEAADLDLRFVQRIEHASTNLSVSVLVVLADALGVLPSQLLSTATLAPSRPGRPDRSSDFRVEQRDTTDDSLGGPVSVIRPRKVGR